MSQFKALLRPVVRQAAALRKSVRTWSDIVAWRMFRSRPELNATVAEAHADGPGAGQGVPANVRGGRIHVRIVFHYAPQRLKFLIETMAAVQSWPFDEIDVWIDTNTPRLEQERAALPGPFRIAVWDTLDHPFKLTWMHRGEMLKRLGDFDAFAYLEDDIIVPAPTLRRWLVETPRLAAHGLLPGLVRVEESIEGTLVLADYGARVTRSEIVTIDGRPYLGTPYPYQACWIYEAAQMRELAARPGYLSGAIEDVSLYERDGPPEMRERVALGLKFVSVPQGFPSRSVVPLTDDLRVCPDALVFHAPCNYATRKPLHPAGLGQIPVDDILSDA